jgi:hypothetical protein
METRVDYGSMKALFAVAGLIGVVVIGLLAVVGLGFVSRVVRLRPQVGAGNTVTAQYASGIGTVPFSIEVRGIERHPQLSDVNAQQGLQLVRVQVAFANASTSQQRADLHDFSLIDATGAHRPPVTGGDSCPAWPVTDLHPNRDDGRPPRDAEANQAGPAFGPMPLCFPVGGNPDAELRLQWDPDVSIAFLSAPVEVLLPATA